MKQSPELLLRVRGIVSDLFLVPIEDVDENSSPSTIPAWDSMGQLNLILELEQEFGMEMTHERVQQMKSVGTIAGVVADAGVPAFA